MENQFDNIISDSPCGDDANFSNIGGKRISCGGRPIGVGKRHKKRLEEWDACVKEFRKKKSEYKDRRRELRLKKKEGKLLAGEQAELDSLEKISGELDSPDTTTTTTTKTDSGAGAGAGTGGDAGGGGTGGGGTGGGMSTLAKVGIAIGGLGLLTAIIFGVSKAMKGGVKVATA